MVIDPPMFDEPVSVNQWKAAQHAPRATTEYTDARPYYRSESGRSEVVDDALYSDHPENSQTQQRIAEHIRVRDRLESGFVAQLTARRHARVRANSD